MPSGPALGPVQIAGEQAGGVPRLVAQTLASYTDVPQPRPGGRVRAGGRVATPPSVAGQAAVSRPDRDGRLGIDRTLVTPVLTLGMRLTPNRFGFAQSLLRDLAADAARNTSEPSAAANARAVADAFADAAGPGRLRVDRDGDPGAGLRLTMDTDVGATVPLQVMTLLAGGGVVHGRIGTVAAAATPLWSSTHWETARRLSPGCALLLLQLLEASTGPAASRSDLDGLVAAGVALGVPEPSLRHNLPRLLPLLAPVSDRWPAARSGEATTTTFDRVTAVPDGLGLLYGLGDLLALRRYL